jgi:hypothetical protein
LKKRKVNMEASYMEASLVGRSLNLKSSMIDWDYVLALFIFERLGYFTNLKHQITWPCQLDQQYYIWFICMKCRNTTIIKNQKLCMTWHMERNKRNERQQGWEMCGDVAQNTRQQLGKIEGCVHQHTEPHLNLESHSKNNLCMNWVSKGTWRMESSKKERMNFA